MKNIVIILAIILSLGFFSEVFAQNEKKTREEKKREKQEKTELQYEFTEAVIDNKQFVLEADFLQNKYGTRVPVSSTINFIRVDSSEVVLQIGNPFGQGYNGVGGVTAEGKITNWDFNSNKKRHTFDISMSIISSLGNYDVFMSIGADGYASASLQGLRGGKLIYSGDIVPASESLVFKGTTSY